MMLDFSCAGSPKGSSIAALALVVAMIDPFSDDEVADICRNAQALLPEAGADADEARKTLAQITLTRTVAL